MLPHLAPWQNFITRPTTYCPDHQAQRPPCKSWLLFQSVVGKTDISCYFTALNISCFPKRPRALTFNKPQNKARCEGEGSAREEAPRCTWVRFTVTSWIKVIRGASFTITQKPVALVLSLSADQGDNRAPPQFPQFLFLSNKNLLV